MKLLTACCLFLLLAPAVFSQTPKADPPKPVPVLSTADKIALQAISAKENELRQELGNLAQRRAQVMGEFSTAHPGYHVDPQTLTAIVDAPKPAAQPGVPKPVPPPTYPAGGGQPK